MDHSNEVVKKLNLELVASGHRIAFKGGFHSLYPVDEVDQEGYLCGVILKPVSLLLFSEALKRVCSNVFNRASHGVNDILEVVLDFTLKPKIIREGDVLLANRGVNASSIWAFTSTVYEFKLVDSLENFRHVNHNLFRSITIGQNIKEIILGDEIESWECTTFGVHEVEQGLLTNR